MMQSYPYKFPIAIKRKGKSTSRYPDYLNSDQRMFEEIGLFNEEILKDIRIIKFTEKIKYVREVQMVS